MSSCWRGCWSRFGLDEVEVVNTDVINGWMDGLLCMYVEIVCLFGRNRLAAFQKKVIELNQDMCIPNLC